MFEAAEAAGGRAGVHHGGDAVVVGPEDLGDAGLDLARVEIAVARDLRGFADQRHGAFDLGIAVAVDHQARIALQHERRVEQLRDPLGHLGRAQVPGDMAPPIGLGDPERAQLSRDPVAGVIADQQERRPAIRPDYGHRRRVIGFEKLEIGCGHGPRKETPPQGGRGIPGSI